MAAPVLGLGLAVTPLLASAAPVPYHATLAASGRPSSSRRARIAATASLVQISGEGVGVLIAVSMMALA